MLIAPAIRSDIFVQHRVGQTKRSGLYEQTIFNQTVKHIHPTRCWTNMFDRLAG